MLSWLQLLEQPVEIGLEEKRELALTYPVDTVVSEVVVYLVPRVSISGHTFLDSVIVAALRHVVLLQEVHMPLRVVGCLLDALAWNAAGIYHAVYVRLRHPVLPHDLLAGVPFCDFREGFLLSLGEEPCDM